MQKEIGRKTWIKGEDAASREILIPGTFFTDSELLEMRKRDFEAGQSGVVAYLKKEGVKITVERTWDDYIKSEGKI